MLFRTSNWNPTGNATSEKASQSGGGCAAGTSCYNCCDGDSVSQCNKPWWEWVLSWYPSCGMNCFGQLRCDRILYIKIIWSADGMILRRSDCCFLSSLWSRWYHGQTYSNRLLLEPRYNNRYFCIPHNMSFFVGYYELRLSWDHLALSS